MPRNWAVVEEEFRQTSPHNFVVVDDMLNPPFCSRLRNELLGHWGWRRKNWVNEYLHNYDPQIDEVPLLAEALRQELPGLLGSVELVRHWAIMANRNVGVAPHADRGALVVNLWLTPDTFNLDPKAGGLVLFDVKREPGMQYHEYNTAPGCIEYLERRTRGQKAVILYRYNRSVIFDARTFHASDRVRFAQEGTKSSRINLSMIFDDPEMYFADRAEDTGTDED